MQHNHATYRQIIDDGEGYHSQQLENGRQNNFWFVRRFPNKLGRFNFDVNLWELCRNAAENIQSDIIVNCSVH